MRGAPLAKAQSSLRLRPGGSWTAGLRPAPPLLVLLPALVLLPLLAVLPFQVHGGGLDLLAQFVRAAFTPSLDPLVLRSALSGLATTVGMALLGWMVSLVLGVVLGLASSRILWSTCLGRAWPAELIRRLLAVPRAIHELLWGLLLLQLVGLQPVVGVVAIAIPFGALVARVVGDLLDSLDTTRLSPGGEVLGRMPNSRGVGISSSRVLPEARAVRPLAASRGARSMATSSPRDRWRSAPTTSRAPNHSSSSSPPPPRLRLLTPSWPWATSRGSHSSRGAASRRPIQRQAPRRASPRITSRVPSVEGAAAGEGAATGAAGGLPGGVGSSGRGGGGGGAAFTAAAGAASRAVTSRIVAGSAAGCAIGSGVGGMKLDLPRSAW